MKNLGYRVLEAEDGETALALRQNHEAPIDLLISDILMPGMQGTELVETLRKARPELPVLLISGYAKDPIDVHTLGELRILEKPFKIVELARRVRQILDRGTN